MLNIRNFAGESIFRLDELNYENAHSFSQLFTTQLKIKAQF